MGIISRYFRIWWLMSRNSFMAWLTQRGFAAMILTGKILAFGFFFGFIYFILKGTDTLAGFTINQTIFFFLTFKLMDTVPQFFFREVYRFRPLIVTGNFDLILAKPMSPLFRSLMGGADVLDLITIPPLLIITYLIGKSLGPTPIQIFFYLLLVINGFLIATAFHITVLSLGIITLEIDHTAMIYRDLTNLGRLPIDIYREPVRGILTYILPVGVMMTFPAKALMGLMSPVGIILSFLAGVIAVLVSIRFWNHALTKYTSASS